MPAPAQPKIYHIVHMDPLPSIVSDGHLWCDARMMGQAGVGTTIGMTEIKRRRLQDLTLASRPGLMLVSASRSTSVHDRSCFT